MSGLNSTLRPGRGGDIAGRAADRGVHCGVSAALMVALLWAPLLWSPAATGAEPQSASSSSDESARSSVTSERAAAQEASPAPERPRRPALTALPAMAPEPDDNRSSPEKIALGKQLFFDPRLSGDNTMSCASCHLPEKAFADGRRQSPGNGGKLLSRNTPGVLNAGFFERLFWDGRAASLEEQALGPIVSPDEMNQDLDELQRELNAVPGYVEQFRQAFGTRVTRQGVAQALAAFQRSLVAGDAPLDRYLAGDRTALSAAARRGMELFVGDAGCIRCHHGPLLSDSRLYRLGVPSSDRGAGAVEDAPRDDESGSDSPRNTSVTARSELRGKFRTPSLRNVAQTAPYMHDGSLATLYDVVEFYYRGVPTSSEHGPLDLEPLLGQSFSEIPDLVAFLEALSGQAPAVTPPELP